LVWDSRLIDSGLAMAFEKIASFTAALLACISVMGCNFEPMLASRDTKTSASEDLAKIHVAYIENRSGQILRNHLIDSLTPRGEPPQPEYTLTIKIIEPLQNLAYQRNNSVSNYGYSVTAYVWLNDKTGTTVLYTTSTVSSQFAVSNSQYATIASLQSARENTLLDISQDIRNLVAQYFVSRKPAASTK
jgi:LPS-assembly lipoprotein